MRRSMGRWLVALFWLTVIVLPVYNFLVDEPHLERAAREAACDGRPAGCAPVLRRFERTAFGRSWDFTFEPNGYVHVDCRRAYIVLGDYACTPLR